MPCFRPLHAYQTDSGKIVFAEKADVKRQLDLPCGRCIGCLLERSRVWAVRCMHEYQMHDQSCFLTLTYDDEHLPAKGMLVYRDWQLFAKRLRKRMGPFRFLMSGEYGEIRDRPHFHACVFGVSFGDRKFFKEGSSGSPFYTSETLSALWPYGHAGLGDVTFESAGYVARYVVKKASRGLTDDERYLRHDEYGVAYWLEPEFSQASTRPGLGATWWAKFGKEVLNRGNVVINGHEMKPPRYYAKLCKDPRYDWVEFQACLNSDPRDNTEGRLRVREMVAKARMSYYKREL